MVDLVAEFTKGAEETRAKESKTPGAKVFLISTPHLPLWELYVDGAAN